MSRQSEYYQNLHLFAGIDRKDSAEIQPEIQAQLDKLLTHVVYTISDIVAEGYTVDVNALAKSIQEGERLSVINFEKESSYLGLHALLVENISQEQIDALTALEQTVFAQILEGLAMKQVSEHYRTLKYKIDELNTFLFANRLEINNPTEFATSLSNALTQVQSQGGLENS